MKVYTIRAYILIEDETDVSYELMKDKFEKEFEGSIDITRLEVGIERTYYIEAITYEEAITVAEERAYNDFSRNYNVIDVYIDDHEIEY